MEYPKCTICGIADATQKNSHLIPSFMVSKVCSYDGSGKRDKEVMITTWSQQILPPWRSCKGFATRIYG